MFIYCLFCRTQRCGIIAEVLHKRGIDLTFSPKIICRERKQGQLHQVFRDLLPGYIFLYHHEDILDSDIIWGIDGVIRRLGRPDNRYLLDGVDLAFAEYLLEKNGVLGIVQVIQEGDQVKAEDPLFGGRIGKVVRLDRRKKRAKIEYEFDGQLRTVWIGCDILYRTDIPDTPVIDLPEAPVESETEPEAVPETPLESETEPEDVPVAESGEGTESKQELREGAEAEPETELKDNTEAESESESREDDETK